MLTPDQVAAIVGLLMAFGAPQATINTVQAELTTPVPIVQTITPTFGSVSQTKPAYQSPQEIFQEQMEVCGTRPLPGATAFVPCGG